MKTRVVVTGMGAITPIGNDVESFWQALKDKTLGIGPITYFDTADFKCKLAAEVKDFDAKAYMDPKTARRMEPFSQFAVAAAKQALEDAGIDMEMPLAGKPASKRAVMPLILHSQAVRLRISGPGWLVAIRPLLPEPFALKLYLAISWQNCLTR